MLRQVGQHIQPDPVAHAIPQEVCLIRAEGEPLLQKIGFDLAAPERKQRADHPPPPGLHARKARKPRAARQVQEHRLRLIIHVVRHGDDVRMEVTPRFLQEIVTRVPPGLLQRLPMAAGKGRHVRMAAVKRHAVKLAEPTHELLVRIRRRAADAVVQVRGVQREPHRGGKRPQRVQKRD